MNVRSAVAKAQSAGSRDMPYAFKNKFNKYLVYEYTTPQENNVYFEKALGSNRLFKDDENDG